jgi:hypothetical protein
VHRFASGLVLEGYADWQDRPDGRDASTLEAFAGWQEKTWRASLQHGRQDRRPWKFDTGDLLGVDPWRKTTENPGVPSQLEA